MRLYKQNQYGRSMIEMLGVLAIVGILSVGGIMGFSSAMTKFKIIKLAEEYNLFLQNILEYEMDWKQLRISHPSAELADVIENMGILPTSWQKKDKFILDSFGGSMYPHIGKACFFVLDYSIKSSKKEAKTNLQLCQAMWLNIIIPNKGIIDHAWIYRGEENGKENVWYGVNQCTDYKNCLEYMKPSDIYAICTTCVDDAACSIALDFC
ncbi:MAG: type II secretion system GspH family protein [Acetobacter sp.]|nr:type II secretion system GspH family protein [Acetobacter sp.]